MCEQKTSTFWKDMESIWPMQFMQLIHYLPTLFFIIITAITIIIENVLINITVCYEELHRLKQSINYGKVCTARSKSIKNRLLWKYNVVRLAETIAKKIAAFSPSVNSDNDTDAVTSDGRPFEIGCGSHKYSVIDREMLGHWSNQWSWQRWPQQVY